MRRGLALILVVGTLGVLAVLASAFAVLSRLERKSASLRVQGTRAQLLARSGIEDAVARLAVGQDPVYGGEDWDGSGTLNGFEGASEVFRPGVLDVRDCPTRQALRPSFFTCSSTDLGADGKAAPCRMRAEGRLRGYSGLLTEGTWALRVREPNAGIHVNGGALGAQVRADPDGPGVDPGDPVAVAHFTLNPNAMAEVAPLSAGGIPAYNDVSMEGPNGFLVRLLNNLDAVVTGGSTLGGEIVGGRPVAGYRSLDELRAVLGAARFDAFKGHLTLDAWVDPTVLKPQPADGRPLRFEDVDDTHRIGSSTTSFAGNVPFWPTPGGKGTAADPWTAVLTNTNTLENGGLPWNYPIAWERSYLFAWRQLRIAPPILEPRAPVALNTATTEVLAAVFLGLKGTWVETWEGSGGWDDGYGWWTSTVGGVPTKTYTYPDLATDLSPWQRTRLDLGMPYGLAGRPWYGPADFDPYAASEAVSNNGKSLVQCIPLGRIRECPAITPEQAKALAGEIRERIRLGGPFRSWAEFNAFVDALPLWEDLDPAQDRLLDGSPYTVVSYLGAVYSRKAGRREDHNADGLLNRRTFTLASGSWATAPVWTELWTGALPPGAVPGLTFVQKDLIRAMANPNTDLNDFNPDANLWKEVDKTDVAGLLRPEDPANVNGSDWAIRASNAYVHTTELSLDGPGTWEIAAVGRTSSRSPAIAGRRALLSLPMYRETTQADFMRASPASGPVGACFQGPSSAYPVAGDQPLVGYPEPQTVSGGLRAADAAYDGQIGLGFTAPIPLDNGGNPVSYASLFGALTTVLGVSPSPDVRGPFQERLVRTAGQPVGSLFPDGGYSEKDTTLKYPRTNGTGCWMKPSWFPEASPGIHALMSVSYARTVSTNSRFSGGRYVKQKTPTDDVVMAPIGLWFLPNRNGYSQAARPVSNYSKGFGDWMPARSVILGQPHNMFSGECLNRAGTPTASARPVGRLQAHRWAYVATGTTPWGSFQLTSASIGAALADGTPSFDVNQHTVYAGLSTLATHRDGTVNHLRFGEVAGENNANYTADATFACLSMGFVTLNPMMDPVYYEDPIEIAKVMSHTGRYYKEDGAAFTSAALPEALLPARLTWTEIPADLWVDQDSDAWMDLLANDRFAPGGRDVHIEIEVWDDRRTPSDATDDQRLARFRSAEGSNRVPGASGRVYYKAVFVNEWDDSTRLDSPLDVTPFLDDVRFVCVGRWGPRWTSWEAGTDD